MTRKGPAKTVDAGFGQGRLTMARAYLRAARAEASLADETEIGNPIMSQIVNAAIAYADALTARAAARVNRHDHMAAVKALRDALGNRLPGAQETRLRRILAEKDEVQYGPRAKTAQEARLMLAQLEAFALWAEGEIGRPI